MIFAAIDIGSNAMRLLFCRVYEVAGKPHFSKEELIRMPIRLGEDVFTKGKISEQKEERLITSLRGFHELIKAYDVTAFRAVATSAMRDASNGEEIIARAKKESGISVEIIDGKLEAALVFSNHIEELLNPKFAYLYIDVGGGSTELTLYFNQKVIAAKSFNIGTVRMLLNKVDRTGYFKAVILPVTLEENPIEIERLETTYQMGEDEKLGYNPIEKYLKAKQIFDKLIPKITENEAIKSISDWMGESESEIQKYLDTMAVMDEYLEYLEYDGIYTQLDSREDQFLSLTKWLNTFYGESSKKGFDGYTDSDVDD